MHVKIGSKLKILSQKNDVVEKNDCRRKCIKDV